MKTLSQIRCGHALPLEIKDLNKLALGPRLGLRRRLWRKTGVSFSSRSNSLARSAIGPLKCPSLWFTALHIRIERLHPCDLGNLRLTDRTSSLTHSLNSSTPKKPKLSPGHATGASWRWRGCGRQGGRMSSVFEGLYLPSMRGEPMRRWESTTQALCRCYTKSPLG